MLQTSGVNSTRPGIPPSPGVAVAGIGSADAGGDEVFDVLPPFSSWRPLLEVVTHIHNTCTTSLPPLSLEAATTMGFGTEHQWLQQKNGLCGYCAPRRRGRRRRRRERETPGSRWKRSEGTRARPGPGAWSNFCGRREQFSFTWVQIPPRRPAPGRGVRERAGTTRKRGRGSRGSGLQVFCGREGRFRKKSAPCSWPARPKTGVLHRGYPRPVLRTNTMIAPSSAACLKVKCALVNRPSLCGMQ